MNHLLVLPMAAYVLGIFLLGLHLFLSRVRSIKSGEVSIKYYRLYDGAPPSPRVVAIGQNFDNQFQVPILFLITGSLFISMDLVTRITILLAWVFVASRVAHTIVHLGSNNVRARAAAYFLGWFAVMGMWVQLVSVSWP